ncbi:MAG: glycosyltransferase family 2 protein [Syntrophaceae bacterium]|nr:glycosyltransferase family 2 protein [Syntrophaceae bacterium]
MLRPDVSVVIVSHNGFELTHACVSSILRNTHEVSYEIIVVDNASTDGTPQSLLQMFPSTRVIVNNVNIGYGAACNQGMRAANGRYVMILNNDTEVLDGALANLAKILDHRSDIGVVAPKLLNPDRTIQPSISRFPSLIPIMIRQIVPASIVEQRGILRLIRWTARGLGINIGRLDEYVHSTEVECPMGSAFMIRRKVIEEVGMFDAQRFFLFTEEADWFYRIRNAGWKIYYTVDATALHHRHQSVNRYKYRYLIQQHKSLLQYFEKHSSVSFVLTYKLLVGMIVFAKATFHAMLSMFSGSKRLDHQRSFEAYKTILNFFVNRNLRNRNVMREWQFKYIE